MYLCWACGGYITPDASGYRIATEEDIAPFPDEKRRRYAIAARVFRTINRNALSREEVTRLCGSGLPPRGHEMNAHDQLNAALMMVLAQLIRKDEGRGDRSLPTPMRIRFEVLLSRARVAPSAPPQLTPLTLPKRASSA